MKTRKNLAQIAVGASVLLLLNASPALACGGKGGWSGSLSWGPLAGTGSISVKPASISGSLTLGSLTVISVSWPQAVAKPEPATTIAIAPKPATKPATKPVILPLPSGGATPDVMPIGSEPADPGDVNVPAVMPPVGTLPVVTPGGISTPDVMPPGGDDEIGPIDLTPMPQPTGTPAPTPTTTWNVSGGTGGGGAATPAPTTPRTTAGTPATFLEGLFHPSEAQPGALTLALPDYTYFQGFAYTAGAAAITGPVRVVGGVFAGGSGKTSTLSNGAMLTTTPDYLRGPGAQVRARFRVVEWKDVQSGN